MSAFVAQQRGLSAAFKNASSSAPTRAAVSRPGAREWAQRRVAARAGDDDGDAPSTSYNSLAATIK